MGFVVITIYAFLILGPGIPLTLAWRQMFFLRHADRQKGLTLLTTVLIVITLSFLWVMAGLLFWEETVLGPSHSTQRSVVIGLNLIVNILAAMVSGCINNQRKLLPLIGACMTIMDWYYLGFVNSLWI